MTKMLEPIAPGEILLEEYLNPLGISQNKLSRDLDVPVSRIAGIVAGTRAITADTALRLGTYFKTSPEMWLTLQSDYDLSRAREGDWPKIKGRIRALESV